MRIKVEEAQRITEKYGFDEVPILFLADVYVNTGRGMVQVSQGMKFDSSQYDLLVNANIKEIDVIYSEKLFAKLTMNFPETYRLPLARKSFIEIDRMVDELDSINTASKRKRSIISLTEVYKKNVRGIYETIIKYGEKLTRKRWNEVKASLTRNTMLDYRIDECGIIVFVILKSGDPLYAQKYMKFTEVVSLIVEHKKAFDMTISPDMNPDYDVFTVTDAAELIATYNNTKAAMVIVADELTDEYKNALAHLKIFDRYVRMMVIKNPDPAKKKEILLMIKNVYGKSTWQ